MAEVKREIRLILPTHDNDGIDLIDVHIGLQTILSLNYGGFTACRAAGGWYNNGSVVTETVTVYDVAVPDNQQTYEELVRLATDLCYRARQEAIYLRWTTGHVRLVKIPDPVPFGNGCNEPCHTCDPDHCDDGS